ncbi:MAG: AAA family ATPase [Candidatus Bipolaricaulia bacterium]
MGKYYGESLPGDELVLVLKDGFLERRPIADIVAQEDTALRVPCFGPDGKIRFGQVAGFYKHPFNGRLLRVRTASGRSIRVTDDHSLFTLDADGVKSIKTSELVVGQSFVAVPKCLPFVAEPLGKLNLLALLRDDDSIVVRGPYVEQLIRQAITALGRNQCAVLLGVSVKYTYDLSSKHVGIRLPRFLHLAEAANLSVDPKRLTLATIKRYKDIPAIMTLSEDLCTFFGLWLAEGSFLKGSVRVSVHADEADVVIALCTRLFGHVTIYRRAGKKAVDILVSSLPLVKAMQALGFVGGARRKRVPAFVYNLSRPNLAAFLRGYISGDGSINRTTPAPQIEISTASTALADDICHLLLYFGIVAKIYDRVAQSHKRICFADVENLERFLKIGFLDSDRISVIKEYLDVAAASRRDRIPLAAVQDLLGYRVHSWEGLTSIGINAVKKRLALLPAPLKPALEGDLFWDKVVAVEELPDHPEFVYDIAVEPGENFVAGWGGIFAHNSEARLRQVFEAGQRNAPSIIFIDEIDAIAPKRGEMSSEKQVERRVVSQLLALMDGLEQRGQLVVIGATNIPDALDPALRRPGRFDREITVPIPNVEGRLEILRIHTRGMPLADDVDLNRLADITHGFVGADLEALCREAAMRALRQILPDLDLESGAIPYEVLFNLRVMRSDFEDALKEIEPSAIREVFIETPDVTWDDIGGLEEIKATLQQVIEWPLKYREAFSRLNVEPASGILLYGPPGTGKTLLVKAIAHETEVNFIPVKGPQLLSMYVGESERKVREIFKKARQAAPCIIFLDEIDALASLRGREVGSNVPERVTSQLLTELDGIESLKQVIVIGATNRIDMMDEALLRPGRLELKLKTYEPDLAERVEIFKVHTRGMPLSKRINLEPLALQTEGMNGADIAYICREAAMRKIVEYVEGKGKVKVEELKLEQQNFETVIQDLRADTGLSTSP